MANDPGFYNIPIVFNFCSGEPTPTTDVGIITEDALHKITTEGQTPIITEDQGNRLGV